MVGKICRTLMMIVVNTNMVVRFTPKAASKKAGLKNIRVVLGKSCSQINHRERLILNWDKLLKLLNEMVKYCLADFLSKKGVVLVPNNISSLF